MKRFIAILLAITLFVTAPSFIVPVSAAESTPPATSITSYSVTGDALNVSWEKINNISGYEVEYADNRFFIDAKRVTITDPAITTKKITSNVTPVSYVRVRTYLTANSAKTTSSWDISDNCLVDKRGSVFGINKGSKKFELRSQAGENVGKYDTLQGGCTYKNTGWFVLYNRNNTKCKIAKVNMDTLKVVKLSKVLSLSHGNDATYNPDRKELVICHGPGNYKKISVIDPNTLKIKKNITLKLPHGTPGASNSTCNKFAGITSIAYNQEHKQYVVRLKTLGNVVIYSPSFNAVKYVALSKKDNQLYQGMESTSDYIMIAQSPNSNGKYNIISVYDWSGKYLSKITLGNSAEIESIFVHNGTLYAGYYKSYYTTYYVSGFKIKVYKGKKNKIKTIFKYTKLMRDNYLYKLENL